MSSIAKLTERIEKSAPASINEDELKMECMVELRKSRNDMLIMAAILSFLLIVGIAVGAQASAMAKYLSVAVIAYFGNAFANRIKLTSALEKRYPKVYQSISKTRATYDSN